MTRFLIDRDRAVQALRKTAGFFDNEEAKAVAEYCAGVVDCLPCIAENEAIWKEPCSFCHKEDGTASTFLFETSTGQVTAQVYDGYLSIAIPDPERLRHQYFVTGINYCPVCGRKYGMKRFPLP